MLGHVHISHVVNIISLKKFHLYFQALIRCTKYIIMMTKERFTEIVNFMTPGVGIFVLGHGHIYRDIRCISEYALASTLSIKSTLIAIVLKDYNAAFLCHC